MAASYADQPVAILPVVGRRISRPARAVARRLTATLVLFAQMIAPYALAIAASACVIVGGFCFGRIGWFVAAGTLAVLEVRVDAERRSRRR